MKAPRSTSGDEQHIQNTKRANMSKNFIAALEFSNFSTKLIKKNMENAKLG